MQFTLVFEADGQGLDEPVFSLRFHPGPIWSRGRRELAVPDRSRPGYALGMVKALLEALGRRPAGKRCAVVAHPCGQGTGRDLETLLFDLQAEGYTPQVVEL